MKRLHKQSEEHKLILKSLQIGEVDAHIGDRVVDATIIDKSVESEGKNSTALSKENKGSNSNKMKKDISNLTKQIDKLSSELLKIELDFIRAGKLNFLLFR